MKPGGEFGELQSSTVCKVVGMAFESADLRKFARRFGIEKDDPLLTKSLRSIPPW